MCPGTKVGHVAQHVCTAPDAKHSKLSKEWSSRVLSQEYPLCGHQYPWQRASQRLAPPWSDLVDMMQKTTIHRQNDAQNWTTPFTRQRFLNALVQTAQSEYARELGRLIWTRLIPSGASWSCGTAVGLCPNGLAALPSESSEKSQQSAFFHMVLIVHHCSSLRFLSNGPKEELLLESPEHGTRSPPQSPTLQSPSGAPSRGRGTDPGPAAARQSGTCRWSCGKSLRDQGYCGC